MLIKRELKKDLLAHLEAKEITLLTGPRQVGKTTLMKNIMNELILTGKRAIFLNLDYESDKSFFTSQEKLIGKVKLEFGDNFGFVFIDEIQRKENAGIFLKGIYDQDLNFKFIVSGSGSIELKEKIHESLSGRKSIFELNPVTFQEFINYKTGYQYENKINSYCEIEKEKTNIYLEEYLNFGGYPRVILENQLREKNRIIDEIFSSYIEKDISYLLKVDRYEIFNMLIRLIASQVGNLVNYSELANSIGISVQTIKNYLWYAEKTYIIHKVKPYFKNIRKEITKSPVLYFLDLGLRNYSIGRFGEIKLPGDYSFVFQNLIFNMLLEKIKLTGNTIHFWRTSDKAEVDFIIKKGEEIYPVEIKYSRLRAPVVTRSFRNFIDKYKPKKAYIVNLSLKNSLVINSTSVSIIPFYEVLSETF